MTTALTSWMLYTAAVTTLLGVAALIADHALREVGRPTRWVWLGALSGSVLVPLATLAGISSTVRPATPLPEGGLIALPPLVVGVESAAGGVSVDAWLLGVWALVSLLLALYVGVSLLRLTAARRTWRAADVEGVEVLLTGNVGPAALGRRILLPEWALAVDVRMRRLMLLHEAEHVRARDPSVLLAALLLVVVLPWNLALWWQLQRLRLAIELDCDARVLRREPDAQLYGRLLLEVGRRRGGPKLVVAFSEPRGFLERRIRAVVRRVPPRWQRGAGLGLVAALVTVLAVCAGDPLRPGALEDADVPAAVPVIAPDTDAGVVTDAAPAASDRALADGPTFTPMTVAPELVNRAEVMTALSENYPPLLRDAGIGGNTTVWFLINEAGVVTRTQLNRSSGYQALDHAALRVAATMRFTPALNRDQRVPVWVSIPIVFQAQAAGDAAAAADATRVRETADAAGRLPRPTAPLTAPPAAGGQTADGPHFTPMTRAPELRNRQAIQHALEENYPPLLRDAGVGGQPTVWLNIDATGRVLRVQLNQSSGTPALDEAALRVADMMEFSPALNRDERVPVWVSIPIVFLAR
jgi:TonB family protein